MKTGISKIRYALKTRQSDRAKATNTRKTTGRQVFY